MNSGLPATVVITTKNRKEELRVALASVVRQSVTCEIIVLDDGSTDGTADMVSAEFPEVILHRTEVSQGLICQRNNGARYATTPVIFSIDDDAAYSSPHVIAQTLAEFDHPRIGAVAIPYSNVYISADVYQKSPEGADRFIIEYFIGVSHAVRRDVFLSIGGYREHFFHQCEEGDFCLRMLNAGYFVRVGRADPVHHYDSPKRDRKRIIMYNARNHVLYAWQNFPLPVMPFYLLAISVRCLQRSRKHPVWTTEGLIRGLGLCVSGRARRAAVARSTFRMSRRLKRNGPLPLSIIESCVPPMTLLSK